jgi:cell division inhibitor SulA/protein ImuA
LVLCILATGTSAAAEAGLLPLENMAIPGNIDGLMDRGLLWRGRGGPAERVEPSGWPALDGLLGGGWPQGALSELIGDRAQGLSLLTPALARLARGPRWLAWIAPPHTPYAPALATAGVDPRRVLLVTPQRPQQALWATEQALAAGTCSAVLAWPEMLRFAELRRLQLAAERGDCLGVLFRPAASLREPSPAALRLTVARQPDGWQVRVVKRRSGWGGGMLALHDPDAGAQDLTDGGMPCTG